MNAKHDREYLRILRNAKVYGLPRDDRTGVGTVGIFAPQLRFDLSKGFPLLTSKQMSLRLVQGELAWMLSGSTNVKLLQRLNNHMWDEWANEHGDLGPVYGRQWRHWPTPWAGANVDQIEQLVRALREHPDSRRHVVTAWNPGEVPHCALPPCHALFQCYSIVTEESTEPPITIPGERPKQHREVRSLSLVMHQRSCDLFLGVPYNIAFYALLTHLLARVAGHQVGELVITLADAHIYRNHLEQVGEQLARADDAPLSPTLWIDPELQDLEPWIGAVLEGNFDLVRAVGYRHLGKIEAEVAV